MTKPNLEPTQITTSAQWDAEAALAIHAITKTTGTPGDAGVTSAAFDDRFAAKTRSVSALTPTTGTVNIDMAVSNGQLRTLALTGPVTFTTSNRAAGRAARVKITADGSTRTITFPSAWTIVGPLPVELEANRVGVLDVTFYGSNDSDAVATWTIQTVVSPVVAGDELTWSPPTGWESYTTYNLPTAGGVVTLNDATDYKLAQSAPITKCVTIKGGRNIVWMGGESKIDTLHSLNESDLASVRFYKSDTVAGRVDGRIIHLEGFWAHGYYASADVQANCPEAIIQIQNCRIEGGAWGRITSLDGVGTPHSDIIQLWGGVKELRVDGLTGLATYQGLQIPKDLGAVGDIYLKRVNLKKNPNTNIEAYQDIPSGRAWPNYVLWTGNDAGTGNIYVENGTVFLYNSTRTLTGGNPPFWPHSYLVGSDTVGSYGYWALSRTDTVVSNWDGTVPGRFYYLNPPGGDYVLTSNVGPAYVSPGYVV